MLWPTLQAAKALGGSASIAELDAAVIEAEQFSSEQQDVLHGDGPQTEIQYRLAWARTYLKGMGLLTNSKRGVWTVTEAGQDAREKQIGPLHSQFVAAYTKKRGKKKSGEKSSVSDEIDQVEAEAEASWKDELLETLLKMAPSAFERLAQRLLRESGFSSATVNGAYGRRRHRRSRRLPDFVVELSRVLSVQEVLGKRHPIRRTRLPGGDGGPGR